jgi:hypothetical protein
MLMMKKPKNLEFEPLHPKNVLLASVVHGISCLFSIVLASYIESVFGLAQAPQNFEIFALKPTKIPILSNF